MLLWAGLLLILAGGACLPIDRQAAHFLYDTIRAPFHHFLNGITHAAKAAHWLAVAVASYAAGWAGTVFAPANPAFPRIMQFSLAFLAALAIGSLVLHSLKFVLGRRRPRDDLEMELYGFVPLSFDLRHNSFPSGHALTIFCVAVIASAALPQWAPLWFLIASLLAATRALLTAHFLSDVLIGAGIGLVAAREVLVLFFPALSQNWF
jgi:membrane-associated phospholipid phosphatase